MDSVLKSGYMRRGCSPCTETTHTNGILRRRTLRQEPASSNVLAIINDLSHLFEDKPLPARPARAPGCGCLGTRCSQFFLDLTRSVGGNRDSPLVAPAT